MSSQEPGTAAPDLPGPVPGARPLSETPEPTVMPPPAPERTPGSGQDWTFEVTDRIESVVGAVRDRTTVPVTRIARALVFGLVAATGGIVALILFVIAIVRILDIYLPVSPYPRRVWIAYAGLGAIFVLGGMFLWSKRKPRRS